VREEIEKALKDLSEGWNRAAALITLREELERHHPMCRTALHPIGPPPQPAGIKVGYNTTTIVIGAAAGEAIHRIIAPGQVVTLEAADGSKILIIPPAVRYREAKRRGRKKKGLVDEGEEGP
jgi:hypothetical protein